MKYNYFLREEMKSIIEGKCAGYRIPMLYNFWCYPVVFSDKEDEAKKLMDTYPYDATIISLTMPDVFKAPDNDENYRWVKKDQKLSDVAIGLDSIVAIEDWDDLDEILETFPDPNYVNLIPESPKDDGKYRIAHWWYCFFERLWSLRGMENALMDFYLYPDEVHRLFDKLTDFYCSVIERSKEELNADGVFTSDDIGTQTGPFFSPEIFEEFFKPYYKRIVDKAHSLGMHFWLHTCGNIEPFIPSFIEIGLDVLHPIQKYTMSEVDIAKKYGDKLCIWAGFDVQRTIPYGTAEDVREEVRYLINTYANKHGRFILTLGNGATTDTPITSLEALLEESYFYGIAKMKEINQK